MRTHTHHRLKLLAVTMVIAVSALAAQPSTADPGPTLYRGIQLSDADLDAHGEEVLHGWIDAWYTGRLLHHWSEAPPELLAQYGHEAVNAWIVQFWERAYVDAYNRNLVAEQARQRATGGRYVDGIEVCNGVDLPPCTVVRRESNFNPNARNPRSTAWGLYQFLRGTWNGVCPEYRHGSAAVDQQVECARRLWNGGRGRSHWSLTL